MTATECEQQNTTKEEVDDEEAIEFELWISNRIWAMKRRETMEVENIKLSASRKEIEQFDGTSRCVGLRSLSDVTVIIVLHFNLCEWGRVKKRSTNQALFCNVLLLVLVELREPGTRCAWTGFNWECHALLIFLVSWRTRFHFLFDFQPFHLVYDNIKSSGQSTANNRWQWTISLFIAWAWLHVYFTGWFDIFNRIRWKTIHAMNKFLFFI